MAKTIIEKALAKKAAKAAPDKVAKAIEKNREALVASGNTMTDAQLRALVQLCNDAK